jgi:hypothetical protein
MERFQKATEWVIFPGQITDKCKMTAARLHGSKIACVGTLVMVQYQEHHLGGGGNPQLGVRAPFGSLQKICEQIFVSGRLCSHRTTNSMFRNQ